MATTVRSLLDKYYGTQQSDTTTVRSLMSKYYGEDQEKPSAWERIKGAVPSYLRGVPQLATMALAPPVYQRIKEPEPWVESAEAGLVGLGRGTLTAGIMPPTEIERKHPIASMVGEVGSLPISGLTGVGALPAAGRVTGPLIRGAATPLKRMGVEGLTRGGIATGVTLARQAVQGDINPRDILFNALTAGVSAIPEYRITPGVLNMIGQVATDLGADVTADMIRRGLGEKEIPPIISARWLLREVPQLIPSLTFATRDVTRRGRMELAAKQARTPAWAKEMGPLKGEKPEVVVGREYPEDAAAVPREMQPIRGMEPGEEPLGLPPGPPPRQPRLPGEPAEPRTFYASPEGEIALTAPEQALRTQIEGYWERISTRTKTDGKPLTERGLKGYQTRFDNATTRLREFGTNAKGVYTGEGGNYVEFSPFEPKALPRRLPATVEETELRPHQMSFLEYAIERTGGEDAFRKEYPTKDLFYEDLRSLDLASEHKASIRLAAQEGKAIPDEALLGYHPDFLNEIASLTSREVTEPRRLPATVEETEPRTFYASPEGEIALTPPEQALRTQIEGYWERISTRTKTDGKPLTERGLKGYQTRFDNATTRLREFGTNAKGVYTGEGGNYVEFSPFEPKALPPRRWEMPERWTEDRPPEEIAVRRAEVKEKAVAELEPILYEIDIMKRFAGTEYKTVHERRNAIKRVSDKYAIPYDELKVEVTQEKIAARFKEEERIKISPEAEQKGETPSETTEIAAKLDALPEGTRFELHEPGIGTLDGTWQRVTIAGDPFWWNSKNDILKTSAEFGTWGREVLGRFEAAQSRWLKEDAEVSEGVRAKEAPTGKIGAGVGTTLKGTALEESRVAAKRTEAQGAGLFEGKEPWQMTREEFTAHIEDRENFRNLKMGSLTRPPYSEFLDATDKYGEAEGYRHLVVKQALSEGKPVPPEVLADYPDLAPRTEAATAALEATRAGDRYEPQVVETKEPSRYDPQKIYDALLDVEEAKGQRDWGETITRLRQKKGYEDIDERAAKVALAEVLPNDPEFRQARMDYEAEQYGGTPVMMHAGIGPKDIGQSLRDTGVLAAPVPEGVTVEGPGRGLGFVSKILTPGWMLKRRFKELADLPKWGAEGYDKMKQGVDALYKKYIDPVTALERKLKKADKKLHQTERDTLTELLLRGDAEGKVFDENDTEFAALSPDAKQIYRLNREYYDSLLNELNAFRSSMGLDPINKRTGYLPHRFLGNWQILVNDQPVIRTDDEGKPIGLFFDTQDEAVRYATELIKDQPRDLFDNPDFDIVVRPKMIQWHGGGAMPLSSKQYWVLTSKLEKILEIPKSEIGEKVMKGFAYIAKDKRRFFGPALKREGLPGYETDWLKLMRYYGWASHRYMAMGEFEDKSLKRLAEYFGLKGTAKQNEVIDILTLGKAPKGHPTLQKRMARYLSDVLGRPTPSEETDDALLANIGKTFPIFDKWLGRPYASRRLGQAIQHPVVLAKLGGLSSGLVNLTQTPLNTLPVLKQWTFVGIKDAGIAYKDHLQGKASKDWDILQELGVSLYTPKYQEGFQRGRLDRILLFFFNKAEDTNRAIAGLGAYKRAISQKMSHADAIRAAKDIIEQTHFRYDVTARPELLRSPRGALLGMFKSYAIKELEFALDLGEGFIKGTDRAALPIFLTTGVGLGGVLGVPGVLALAEVGELLFGRKFLSEGREWLQKNMTAKLPGTDATAGEMLSYGVGAIVDTDVSWRVGPGDLFPTAASDFLGPLFSMLPRIQRARKRGEKPLQYLPREISPGLTKHVQGLHQLASEIIGKEPEPFRGKYRARKEYEPTPRERIMRGLGLRTITEAKSADVRTLTAQTEREAGRFKRDTIDEMIDAIQGKDLRRGKDLMEEALGRGVTITASDIEQEIEKKEMPRLARQYGETPKNQRDQFIQRMEIFGLTGQLKAVEPQRQRALQRAIQEEILEQFTRGERKEAWTRLRGIGFQNVFPGKTRNEFEAMVRRYRTDPSTFEELVGEIELNTVQEQVLDLFVQGKAREGWQMVRKHGGLRNVFKGSKIQTRETLNNEVRRRQAYKKAG